MIMKKIFLQGIVSGVLAAIAGVLYMNIYQGALATDFSKIVNIGSVVGASIFGCVLMSVGYFLLKKFNKVSWKGALNIVIAVLSFASIISPMAMSLPLDIENPELFPGLIVPMHFFPALAFFCIEPFFSNLRTA
jgi:L-cystine uptake protein TcyP (sodium:dicarboxylate symporter family)